MKVLRIHLRDYKGVDDAEVEFAPAGVTIVEGPNEIGKTSLCEALTLILEHLDSSTRAEIRDAKPVHNDAGPWVEVELTAGDYHLVVEKRWLRSPMTHLRVLAPHAEEMTGREAHERLRAILDETLDQQLFAALHYLQGVGITQAALGGSVSLAAALDAAASGQSLAGGRETSILERVRDERTRYFTQGGRPLAERGQRALAVAGLRAQADQVAAQIAALDDLADTYRSRLGEQARLELERVNAQAQLEAETHVFSLVQEARRAAQDAATRASAAAGAAAEATRRRDVRIAQRTAEQDSQHRRDRAVAAVDALRPGIEAADAALAASTARRNAARQARLRASEARARAQDDHDYARRTISRELWNERLTRVRVGQQELAATAELVAKNRMDAEILAAIEAASTAVTAARARLSTASAGIAVAALADVAVRLGDQVRDLRAGDVLDARVEGELTLEVGRLARLTVTGGAPELSLKRACHDAERQFAAMLADAGLPATASIAECRLAAQERRDACVREVRARQTIAEGLRDLTVERLEQEVADDDEYLRAHAERDGPRATAPDLDQATARLAQAERALADAVAADDAAGQTYDAAQASRAEAQRAISDAETELRVAAALHDTAVEALRLARAQQDDAGLVRELAESEQIAAKAAREVNEANVVLAGLDPESVEARRSNLDAVVSRLALAAQTAQQELVALRTELALRGEEGLHDRLDELETRFARAAAAHERAEHAARTVELLWDRLVAQRDAAQRSYVAPYRAEIERLGRIVYGPSFAVEINHGDLTVATRTLNGRTIAFERLSTGAREQLCVLSLLACAGIVAADGRDGAPVIIDDALGWTDHDRLERLGAAFAAAGRTAQVIVLTCDPGRYRTVGSATVRRLRPGAVTAPAPPGQPA